ncbi:SDR family oxidoreductase [Methylophilus aquaticus]|uniref:SDR family oxidoreductase n=1 Tax=Methylophilus aquaticus TaxID=1971610 RepID=A0ABT9JPG2_9PROT|nr:SDR family oxidoreductase [Methylophilus aquaticus]MDP8566457.1 SDR family oxidoreductase [Methylophilus aquaticus]
MQLHNQHIVLTGATGGLGLALAHALQAKGAVLCLVGRDPKKLHALQQALSAKGGQAHYIVVDLTQAHMATQLVKQAVAVVGTVDMVINNAGVIDFTAFEQQTDEAIAQMIHTNVTATIQISRAFAAYFKQREHGRFVFIGSIFGSLGFPHFATYCASKFAVHGFSQALRRELADTPIGVTYVAPRAIATAMNDDRTNAMWKASGQAIDRPDDVASQVVRGLEREKQEIFIGQPQSFFAWMNGVAPRLVNLGLKQQASLAKRFL